MRALLVAALTGFILWPSPPAGGATAGTITVSATSDLRWGGHVDLWPVVTGELPKRAEYFVTLDCVQNGQTVLQASKSTYPFEFALSGGTIDTASPGDCEARFMMRLGHGRRATLTQLDAVSFVVSPAA